MTVRCLVIIINVFFIFSSQANAIQISPDDSNVLLSEKMQIEKNSELLLTLKNLQSNSSFRIEISSPEPLLEPEIIKTSQGTEPIITSQISSNDKYIFTIQTSETKQDGSFILKLNNDNQAQQHIHIETHLLSPPNTPLSNKNIVIVQKIVKPIRKISRRVRHKWLGNFHPIKGQLGRHKGKKIRIW